MSRYIAMQPLVPGRRVDVLEKNEQGHTVGAWYGYWNYRTQTVTLYPNVRYKYANWPGGRKPDKKKFISDRDIEVERPDRTSGYFRQRKPAAQKASEDEIHEGETWRDRKLPMQGQERMEI